MRFAKASILVAAGVLVAWVWGWAEENPTKPVPLDGATLYRQYCAVCHGKTAKGDGPMAKMLVAETPDLTRIAERNGGKFPRTRIDKIISGEYALPGGHGTREMPIWGPVFSEVDRDVDLGNVRVDNVARYLESLQEK